MALNTYDEKNNGTAFYHRFSHGFTNRLAPVSLKTWGGLILIENNSSLIKTRGERSCLGSRGKVIQGAPTSLQ